MRYLFLAFIAFNLLLMFHLSETKLLRKPHKLWQKQGDGYHETPKAKSSCLILSNLRAPEEAAKLVYYLRSWEIRSFIISPQALGNNSNAVMMIDGEATKFLKIHRNLLQVRKHFPTVVLQSEILASDCNIHSR